MLRGKDDGVRLFLVLLTMAAMVAGCSGGSDANAPEHAGKEGAGKAARAAEDGVAAPADVPEYVLTKDEATADPALGLRMRGVSASTKTTSAEGMEAITRELWSETEDAEALVAAFYPDKPMAELSGTGYAFRNREAARHVVPTVHRPLGGERRRAGRRGDGQRRDLRAVDPGRGGRRDRGDVRGVGSDDHEDPAPVGLPRILATPLR